LGSVGTAAEVKNGDQIAVYEVDKTYLKDCDSTTMSCGPQTGLITGSCKCLAEDYQLWVGSAPNKVEIDLGMHTGTNPYIDVKIQ